MNVKYFTSAQKLLPKNRGGVDGNNELFADVFQNVLDLSVETLGVGGVLGGEVIGVTDDAIRKQTGEAQIGKVHSHVVSTVLEDQIQHFSGVRVTDVTAGEHGVVISGLDQLIGQHDVCLENFLKLLLFDLIHDGGGDAQGGADVVRPGDVLILTKPLGIGILTTAAKADLVDETLLNRIYAQMTYLNKTAAHIMRKYEVHSCTDVTGFSLLGHSFEMAQGSDCTIHIDVANVPFHKEAYEFAEMGFIPAGAYRNRDFAENGVHVAGDISRAMQDIMYDPQTSGGLLIAVAEKDAAQLHHELVESGVQASIVGHVTGSQDYSIILK